jgi:DNA-binding transcriptional MerR regulator
LVPPSTVRLERSGLTASRIRFYAASGLINAVERNANGYREYNTEAVVTLDIITSAQKAGVLAAGDPQPAANQLGTWHQDKLLDVLRKKVADIEALRERLAHSRAQLVGIIKTIETSPEGLSCDDNRKRVLNRIPRHRMARPKTRTMASAKR